MGHRSGQPQEFKVWFVQSNVEEGETLQGKEGFRRPSGHDDNLAQKGKPRLAFQGKLL